MVALSVGMLLLKFVFAMVLLPFKIAVFPDQGSADPGLRRAAAC